MSHHRVEVQNLHYCYPDHTPALSGISFVLEHGESLAVVGANGSGKSTLLLHLNGTLQPTSGVVRIGDFPIQPNNLREIRRTVGMVFQHADEQLFMPTVFEDVAFGPRNLGCPEEEIQDRVAKALEQVNANGLQNRATHRLSGGEKRLVALATVLAMEASILVLDEPSAHLDPHARRRLIRILQQFSHTKIIATHDLDLAYDLCSRTIILDQGRILADGATKILLKDQKLLESSNLELPLGLQRRCEHCWLL